MAYSLTGDGPIDLVLVPGFVSNLEAVFELPAIERGVTRLASFARVISFAKPGTGLSDPIEAPRTLEHRDLPLATEGLIGTRPIHECQPGSRPTSPPCSSSSTRR